ncbi:NADH-quinone oxidoreductase subunit C [Myxococcota bacterium]|nr:NADH-quinone oxidoreductase subunit C [Myxococcota bacterium]
MNDFGSPGVRCLMDQMPSTVRGTHVRSGQVTVTVAAEDIVSALRLLRDGSDPCFDLLVDLCAVDCLGRTPRFEVVYHLYSLAGNQRLRVRAMILDDPPQLDSSVEVFPAANWLEREAWDLYGIRFRNHPDPTRLLLGEDFEGHPLRRDHTIAGSRIGTESSTAREGGDE